MAATLPSSAPYMTNKTSYRLAQPGQGASAGLGTVTLPIRTNRKLQTRCKLVLVGFSAVAAGLILPK